MEQQNLFKIRDKRKKGWFFMDNEYLNGYAKHFGAVGTAIYVSLCRHANNETQSCFPSINTISEELSISKPTVIKYLKLFITYKLIEKSKRKRNSKQQWLNNEYFLLDKTEWVKSSQVKPFNLDSQVKPFTNPSKTVLPTQVKPFNTKETNIKKTNIRNSNTSVAGKEINDLISLFEPINPSYKRLYSNKTQREALERLLKQMGREKLEGTIKFAESAFGKDYAPTITTPKQLEDNLGKLMAYYKKQKSDKNIVGIVL